MKRELVMQLILLGAALTLLLMAVFLQRDMVVVEDEALEILLESSPRPSLAEDEAMEGEPPPPTPVPRPGRETNY